LTSAEWGRKINGDKSADTNTLLAIRAIANLFTTAQGREILAPAAEGLMEELESKGDWEGKGKWKGPVATIGLKCVHRLVGRPAHNQLWGIVVAMPESEADHIATLSLRSKGN
jgi:phospholipase A-2-activating protein